MTAAEFRNLAIIHAMQGILAGLGTAPIIPEQIAEAAVRCANALLEANTTDEEIEP